jgi:hypothetical protein
VKVIVVSITGKPSSFVERAKLAGSWAKLSADQPRIEVPARSTQVQKVFTALAFLDQTQA